MCLPFCLSSCWIKWLSSSISLLLATILATLIIWTLMQMETFRYLILDKRDYLRIIKGILIWTQTVMGKLNISLDQLKQQNWLRRNWQYRSCWTSICVQFFMSYYFHLDIILRKCVHYNSYHWKRLEVQARVQSWAGFSVFIYCTPSYRLWEFFFFFGPFTWNIYCVVLTDDDPVWLIIHITWIKMPGELDIMINPAHVLSFVWKIKLSSNYSWVSCCFAKTGWRTVKKLYHTRLVLSLNCLSCFSLFLPTLVFLMRSVCLCQFSQEQFIPPKRTY